MTIFQFQIQFQTRYSKDNKRKFPIKSSSLYGFKTCYGVTSNSGRL